MSDESERELLDAARSGDDRALEELLRRHQDQLYRFGMRMCGVPEDAEDVVQDTMLAMVRGVEDFRGASSLSTWLYAIARNACNRKRRKGKHAPDAIEPLHEIEEYAASDDRPNPEETATSREIERALKESIAQLDPVYREVLVLRDVEGLSTAEVAEVVGATPQAIKTRLHRARLAVRERLAATLEPPSRAAQSRPCRDVLTTYSRYLEGELSPDICAEMESHVQDCPGCRQSCDSLRETLGLCRTIGRDEPVPGELQLSIKKAFKDFLRKA